MTQFIPTQTHMQNAKLNFLLVSLLSKKVLIFPLPLIYFSNPHFQLKLKIRFSKKNSQNLLSNLSSFQNKNNIPILFQVPISKQVPKPPQKFLPLSILCFLFSFSLCALLNRLILFNKIFKEQFSSSIYSQLFYLIPYHK